ncbi:MAG TPA: adenylate/guanylate cyclase domain-containing protein [Gaiellaceae bacterium]|nr:adenylate/guanylate cyclase domain-containing protein [Gaiellaceae bacterium]
MTCATCGAENPPGHRFCGQCGSALSTTCPACGHEARAGERFCGACGTPLVGIPAQVEARAPEPVAERRLVTVLFADLVGFTPLSESRDPEEVRELLSRYFDACRRLVELYGGVVEKFIGDAVMAVWGAPAAQEDDAERAVRTALDLVAAVSALGDEVGAADLRARAGVLTGEAAVNVGAVGEGMVAGDLVNTASRIQASAEPGTVLVGDATRRASEAAVVFEDAGAHTLKGKAEPVRLWRAVRVTAARGGALRSEGLEAPFVGRQRELRLVKELYHAAAEQSRAQLVQITGIAGIGKSRLAWEFEKYLDGIDELVWWHRGRCLAYGEGVAYWALAEMVRTRAGIVEGEEQESARQKLAACLAQHLPDDEERAWVGPRLANLLGLEERADTDRQDLFAAWRLFFERLADQGPVAMLFEDLQWADEALLAFVEYLLEWSASQRLYVVVLARPELAGQHPEFARGVRNSTSLALEPLSEREMAELLDGYVPGLPDEVKSQVLERAQGVPLYAVETVRMLLDRGLLVRDGPVYRPTGEIASLDVPETLHALAAARLDGLTAEERQLVQQASVLGKTFTKQALAAMTGASEEELDPLLASLIRKEVLSLQADPRSPGRGQYGFLQELLRQVAYETLARKERKSRHLAALAAIEATFADAEQDVPEVLAAHLLAAADAAPNDPDVGEIRTRARAALAQAGERAAALAAPAEAQRHFDQAAELAAGDPAAEAALLERAGSLAFHAGTPAAARERLERAIDLHERHGDPLAAARAGIVLADIDVSQARIDEGRRRLEAAVAALEQAGPTAELAATLAHLARMQSLAGDADAAAQTVDRALRLADMLGAEVVFVDALTIKASVLLNQARLLEARVLFEAARPRARATDLSSTWWRATNNLALLLEQTDEYEDGFALTDEMETLARQRGDLELLAAARFGVIATLVELGRWDEALARADEALEVKASLWATSERISVVAVHCERGDLVAAERLMAEQAHQRTAGQAEFVVGFAAMEARLHRARGRFAEGLAAAERGLSGRGTLTLANPRNRICLVEALEGALALDDLARCDELLALLDALPPGQLTPSLSAWRHVFHARLAARRDGMRDVDEHFRRAEGIFGERGLVFHLARTELEHAEWLQANGRAAEAEPLLAQAREVFERLEARPWLGRLDGVARAEVPA